MKNVFLLLFILFTCACSTQNSENTLLLGGKDKLILQSDIEKVVEIDKNMLKEYESILNINKLENIPLHKAVKTKDYTIYIGLPLNSTFDSIRAIFENGTPGSDLKVMSKYEDLNVYLAPVFNQSSSRMYLFMMVSNKSDLIIRSFNENIAIAKITFIK